MRRQAGGQDKPHEHHTALPLSLMLALTTLSLLWGWSREAAIIAMGWAGVLRIGEIFPARRAVRRQEFGMLC